MKTTLLDILNSHAILMEWKNLKLSPRFGLTVIELSRAMESKIDSYNEARNKLADEYATRLNDDHGQPTNEMGFGAYNDQGEFVPDLEKRETFFDALNELQRAEVELPGIGQIPIEAFEKEEARGRGFEPTLEQMGTLYWLISRGSQGP